jgi:hypothetical protein
MRDPTALDVTSAEILDELVDTLRSAGIALWLADLRGPVLDRARRTGLLRTVGEDQVFRTVEEAIDAVPDRRPPVRVQGPLYSRPPSQRSRFTPTRAPPAPSQREPVQGDAGAQGGAAQAAPWRSGSASLPQVATAA